MKGSFWFTCIYAYTDILLIYFHQNQTPQKKKPKKIVFIQCQIDNPTSSQMLDNFHELILIQIDR